MRKPIRYDTLEDLDLASPKEPRFQTFRRLFFSHVAVVTLATVLTGGLSLKNQAEALAQQRETFQQLAVYAGCGHVDQVGNYAWKDFPTAMGENGEPIAAPPSRPKPKRLAKGSP